MEKTKHCELARGSTTLTKLYTLKTLSPQTSIQQWPLGKPLFTPFTTFISFDDTDVSEKIYTLPTVCKTKQEDCFLALDSEKEEQD